MCDFPAAIPAQIPPTNTPALPLHPDPAPAILLLRSPSAAKPASVNQPRSTAASHLNTQTPPDSAARPAGLLSRPIFHQACRTSAAAPQSSNAAPAMFRPPLEYRSAFPTAVTARLFCPLRSPPAALLSATKTD